MNLINKIILVFLTVNALNRSATAQINSSWLQEEHSIAVEKMMRNISPSDAKPGIIVAAQTRNNPNYYYHWVRDAALTMESVIAEYKLKANPSQFNKFKKAMMDYLDISIQLQKVKTQTGLGEPKFNPDGSAFNDPWGRPQNDGPALRAISTIHIAEILLKEGQSQFVKEMLYDGKLPAETLIKKDLEYVAHNWRSPSFDLWEEVLGDHFYTRMVQRRALKEGAAFARRMGDTGAADFYKKESEAIELSLNEFWDAKKGYYVSTLRRVGGLDYKTSGIDSAFALALIHGSMDDGFMPLNDSKVIATLDAIEMSFARIYPVNHWDGKDKSGKKVMELAPAIGRYPEDQYAGNRFGANLGNPWPLCTLAFAEVYYRMPRTGNLNKFTNKLTIKESDPKNAQLSSLQKADLFVARVQYHANPDGSLNEQIDRNNGYMSSVSDLTWNYAAIISTYSIKTLTSASH